MENIYKMLAEGGGFSLPYLLHIYDEQKEVEIFVINDNSPLEYGGNVYEASSFTYTPNDTGDSSLEIELVEHDRIIDILENNHFFHVDIVGILYDGEVQELTRRRHIYGDGTWNEKSLQLKLSKDDRLDMTFPALIFNSYNNRGNT